MKESDNHDWVHLVGKEKSVDLEQIFEQAKIAEEWQKLPSVFGYEVQARQGAAPDTDDLVDALIAAVRLLEQVEVWQPIETAPKDGTEVLLRGGKNKWEDEGTKLVVGFWQDDEWRYAFIESDWRGVYENPTHWMYVPNLPKEIAE